MKKEEENNFMPAGISIYKKLCRSKELIDDCYDQPLDLQTIARQACFSPYHFLRVFKKVYNKTPHQYLTDLRIDKAKEMLKKDGSSVTEVCFDVGFQSLGSFSSLFTKNVGISPVEFRKQCMRRLFLAVRFPEKLIPACYLYFMK